LTTATDGTALIGMHGRSGIIFKNTVFSNTASVRAACVVAESSQSGLGVFDNDVFDGCAGGIQNDTNLNNSFQALVVQNTEIKNSTTYAIDTTDTTLIKDSYIHDNTGPGVRIKTAGGNIVASITIVNSVIRANSKGLEINVNSGVASPAWKFVTLINSDLTGNTGNAIDWINGPNWTMVVQENLINYANGGFGVSFDTHGYTVGLDTANAYGSNTSGNFNNITDTAAVTLTASPFVGAPNFALNSTAGGGAAVKGTGNPGVTGFIGTGHADIGALQSAGSGGGSAVVYGAAQ